MEQKYTVFNIADYFLFKAEQDQERLSNLKLQKLVYYSQGLHLVVFDGKPLFDEQIEAWTYGPVVPELYRKYKVYEAGGIPADDNYDPLNIDEETRDFLDEVYDVFGQFSAVRLMDICHGDDCWRSAHTNAVIPLDAMKKDLRKYLKDE